MLNRGLHGSDGDVTAYNGPARTWPLTRDLYPYNSHSARQYAQYKQFVEGFVILISTTTTQMPLAHARGICTSSMTSKIKFSFMTILTEKDALERVQLI